MTKNQIDYWKLQEEKRSNLAKEQETQRANKAQEDIGYIDKAEQARHNLITEGIQNLSLQESNRHNVVTEAENQRSNVAREQLQKYSTDVNASVGYNAASTSAYIAGLQVGEQVRHNMAFEENQLEQIASNERIAGLNIGMDEKTLSYQYDKMQQDKELKTKELNVRSGELDLAKEELAETIRTHKVNESQGWWNTGLRGVQVIGDFWRSNASTLKDTTKAIVPILKLVQ